MLRIRITHVAAGPAEPVRREEHVQIWSKQRCMICSKTLAIPVSLRSEVIHRAERLVAQQAPPSSPDQTAIEAQMQRLTDVYIAGRIDKGRYTSQIAELERQLVTQPLSAPLPDLEQAAKLLLDLPRLYEEATIAERRALVRLIFSHLWMERHELKAITPTGLYLPLMAAAHDPEVGEPGGARTHDIHLKGCCSTTELPAHRHYTQALEAWQAFDALRRPTYNPTTPCRECSRRSGMHEVSCVCCRRQPY